MDIGVLIVGVLSYIGGFITAVIIAIISSGIIEMITRPHLSILENTWIKRKWVAKLEKKQKLDYFFQDPKTGITLTTTSASSTENFSSDEWEISESNYFDFYGISIKNDDDPNFFIHRKTAEITKTELFLDDDYKMDCRWWSKDYADEGDKLLAGESFNTYKRSKNEISSGDFKYLVIAYKPSEKNEFSLFNIASDVKDNLWNKKHIISKFPRYAILAITTSAKKFHLKLKIELNTDNNIEISKITHFPDFVFREKSKL